MNALLCIIMLYDAWIFEYLIYVYVEQEIRFPQKYLAFPSSWQFNIKTLGISHWSHRISFVIWGGTASHTW
jgi:hypothetical protein